MEVIDSIREQVEGNSVILYMKGTPSQPQCGFSATAVQALIDCGQRFAYVDVLSNPAIRANLPKYGDWPTFPQLWVAGELVGGSDIVAEIHKSGRHAKGYLALILILKIDLAHANLCVLISSTGNVHL